MHAGMWAACTAVVVASDSSTSSGRSKSLGGLMRFERVVVLPCYREMSLAHLLLLPLKQPWVLRDDLLDHVRLAAASCCC